MNPVGRPHGFSLPELLIALALGLLVTAGLARLFVAGATSSRARHALLSVHEQGRFAAQELRSAVRLTGARIACGESPTIRSHLALASGDPLVVIHAGEEPVLAWDFRGTGEGDALALPAPRPGGADASAWSGLRGHALPREVARRAVPGSDVLFVRAALPVADVAPCQVGAVAFGTCDRAGRAVPHGLGTGRMVLLAECGRAGDLFQHRGATLDQLTRLGSGNAMPGNGVMPWTTTPGPTTQLYRAVQRFLFIGRNAGGEPALYALDLGLGSTTRARELAPGVENLQVRLGVASGTTLRFLSPGQVTGGAPVQLVRTSILVRAEAPASLQDRAPRQLEGTEVTPRAGAYLRRVFSLATAVGPPGHGS